MLVQEDTQSPMFVLRVSMTKKEHYFWNAKSIFGESRSLDFANQIVLGAQLNSLPHVLPMAAFMTQLQRGVVATETVWLEKPKIFTIWPFIQKVF